MIRNIISREDWERCDQALRQLHFLANCYRANGHMEVDVVSHYFVLQDLLTQIEPPKEEKKKDYIKIWKN